MKGILSGLLFAACLWGQTPSLPAALDSLKNPQVDRVAAGKRIVDAMLALADPQRRPSRRVVEEFAGALTGALAGNADAVVLQFPLTELMKGSHSNLTSSSQFRQFLEAMHVSDFTIRALVTRFLKIGEEVRGPDDLHISRLK